MTIFLCIIAFFSDLIIADKLNLAKRDFEGKISYTDFENTACGINTNDKYVCAVSGDIFNKTSLCNSLIQVDYGLNSVNVTVVDSCEDCNYNDLTLSQAAFQVLADLSAGVINGTWNFVPTSPSQ
ncbi:9459_t:CDS:1 [Dentiscutata erythropus]|uniref:9459_t:CDS:1 n=1 Tax=Dentiscutata erythropus TaxID=1348616 RepID=A0A9N9BYV3_9GLOM|nr:9459_t:CDS:1 [Dentiscutata erythropus]